MATVTWLAMTSDDTDLDDMLSVWDSEVSGTLAENGCPDTDELALVGMSCTTDGLLITADGATPALTAWLAEQEVLVA
jgi:hypothetical protein